jgi:hypothetical protein
MQREDLGYIYRISACIVAEVALREDSFDSFDTHCINFTEHIGDFLTETKDLNETIWCQAGRSDVSMSQHPSVVLARHLTKG